MHIGVVRLTKSNASTFICAQVYRIFLTLCVGFNLGDFPWGHPLLHASSLSHKIL